MEAAALALAASADVDAGAAVVGVAEEVAAASAGMAAPKRFGVEAVVVAVVGFAPPKRLGADVAGVEADPLLEVVVAVFTPPKGDCLAASLDASVFAAAVAPPKRLEVGAVVVGMVEAVALPNKDGLAAAEAASVVGVEVAVPKRDGFAAGASALSAVALTVPRNDGFAAIGAAVVAGVVEAPPKTGGFAAVSELVPPNKDGFAASPAGADGLNPPPKSPPVDGVVLAAVALPLVAPPWLPKSPPDAGAAAPPPKRLLAGFAASGLAAAGVPDGVVEAPKLNEVAGLAAAGVVEPKAFPPPPNKLGAAGLSPVVVPEAAAAGWPKENVPPDGVVVPLAGFAAPKRDGVEAPPAAAPDRPPNIPPVVPVVAGLAPNKFDVLGAAIVVDPNCDGALVVAVVADGVEPKEKPPEGLPAAAPSPKRFEAGAAVVLVAPPNKLPFAGLAAAPPNRLEVVVVWPNGLLLPVPLALLFPPKLNDMLKVVIDF